ncbi:unnamed protein product [Rhizopus stolonifer]
MEIQFGKPIAQKLAKEKHNEWWSKSKMPLVKLAAIQKLIEQQNKLFEKSMHTFLDQCQKEGINPSDHLLRD